MVLFGSHQPAQHLVIGVLAIQGAFLEHVEHLNKAIHAIRPEVIIRYGKTPAPTFEVIEVRTPEQLARCVGLIIPGGESTAISLVAQRTGMLEPLREFIAKAQASSKNSKDEELARKKSHGSVLSRTLSNGGASGKGKVVLGAAVWGTCAGLILIAKEASGARKGGQELLGGLDIRVARNHFGSQADSFVSQLEMPCLIQEKLAKEESLKKTTTQHGNEPPMVDKSLFFPGIFIRAPVVEAINISKGAEAKVYFEAKAKDESEELSIAKAPTTENYDEFIHYNHVQVLATLPVSDENNKVESELCVAVRQGRILGTSFHPELTSDTRLHEWWIKKCVLQLLE